MEFLIPCVLLLAPIVFVLVRSARKKALCAQIREAESDLSVVITQHFLTQPCSRCHESEMCLLTVSPNARSIQCQCLHCRKRQHAAATSPDAFDAAPKYERLHALISEYNERYGRSQAIGIDIRFCTPAAPLPFEQTTREHISESTRTEVWRRDGGQCVQCGSNAQLEFDHIIPVSRGGATSPRNLQLLCKLCNRAKSAKI